MNVVISNLISTVEHAESLCPLLMDAMQGFWSLRGSNYRIYRVRRNDVETLHFRPITESISAAPDMLLLDRFVLLDLEQRYLLLADMAHIIAVYGQRGTVAKQE